MDLLAVGIVKSPHGVKGELMVHSFSGSTDRWPELREARFRNRTGERSCIIESVRSVHGGALLKLKGCDSREKAQGFVGCEVWVERGYACPLSAEEYYTADLCRCSVFFHSERIGAVRAVLNSGRSQFLEIVDDGGKAHVVPFTDHFIGEVDPAAGRIALKEDCIVR